jgi:predicted deacylase
MKNVGVFSVRSETISVGNITVPPGTKRLGSLKVAERPDGSDVNVQLIVINGSRPGPKLWLQAGCHAVEYDGIETVRRIVKETDPEMIEGTLFAVPVLNVTAFQEGVSSSYVDHANMNRYFRDKPGGTITARTAHSVFKEIAKNATHLVDLHTGGTSCTMCNVAVYHQAGGEVEEASFSMAKVFGTNVLWRTEYPYDEAWLHDSSFISASYKGIPAIIVESGGGAGINEQYVKILHRGVINIMKYLKMIPGEPEISDKKQTLMHQADWIECNRGGMLHLNVNVHDEVSQGARIAEVENLSGDVLEKITSPKDGIVAGTRLIPIVNAGDSAVLVGRIVSRI